MNKDDGGPAFPSGALDVGRDKVESPVHDGMTLRDWFAGQVVSVLKAPGFSVAYGDSECRTFARQAYKLADAMLAARKDDHDGR